MRARGPCADTVNPQKNAVTVTSDKTALPLPIFFITNLSPGREIPACQCISFGDRTVANGENRQELVHGTDDECERQFLGGVISRTPGETDTASGRCHNNMHDGLRPRNGSNRGT